MTPQVLDRNDMRSIVAESDSEFVVRVHGKERETKLDHVLEVELDPEADGAVVHVLQYAW